MEIQRTAVVKLSVPDERRDDLKRTMNTFRDAAQRFADRGWDGDDNGYVITSRSRFQPHVYDNIREDTGLHSDLPVAAVNHAADALTGYVDKMKAGERSLKPVFTSNTTVYNTSAISYFDRYCSLAAYGSGRVHAEDNRDGDDFVCQKCGKELHSDYNAARNIVHRYVQNRLKSGSGRANNHLALKSGTLNGNGDYSRSTV